MRRHGELFTPDAISPGCVEVKLKQVPGRPVQGEDAGVGWHVGSDGAPLFIESSGGVISVHYRKVGLGVGSGSARDGLP